MPKSAFSVECPGILYRGSIIATTGNLHFIQKVLGGGWDINIPAGQQAIGRFILGLVNECVFMVNSRLTLRASRQPPCYATSYM